MNLFPKTISILQTLNSQLPLPPGMLFPPSLHLLSKIQRKASGLTENCQAHTGTDSSEGQARSASSRPPGAVPRLRAFLLWNLRQGFAHKLVLLLNSPRDDAVLNCFLRSLVPIQTRHPEPLREAPVFMRGSPKPVSSSFLLPWGWAALLTASPPRSPFSSSPQFHLGRLNPFGRLGSVQVTDRESLFPAPGQVWGLSCYQVPHLGPW